MPTTWELQGDCTALSQINLPEGVTLDGNGYTISAGFAYTNNSNNSVVGIVADNVTVKDVTIDGVAGMGLHGVNVYTAEGVQVSDTTITNNDGAGLVVNGSLVTVTDLTTSGNGAEFNNQGQCVSYVTASDNAKFKR